MRSTTTFSILFWTYTQRAKNNKSNVYARITINGNQVNISLHEKVNVKLWDSRLQKAKGNRTESRMFNFYLDEVRADLVQCYRDLRQENRILTPQLIKARYLGEDKKIHSLKDIFDYHTETMGTKLCAKTLCHYRTSQKYILAYVLKKFKSQDRYLNDLNYAFVLGFESFLRSYQPKHYQGKIGNNAVMKHIQRLRKMVTLAYDIEWIERDPFIKFKPKLEKKEREFLTDSELQKIEDFQTSIERLEVVRDLYI